MADHMETNEDDMSALRPGARDGGGRCDAPLLTEWREALNEWRGHFGGPAASRLRIIKAGDALAAEVERLTEWREASGEGLIAQLKKK